MDLVNKKIVLTGAASGIGLALLNMLARQQVQILAVDVNEEALKTVCNNLL
jgi:NAD(P)-dependent dehydrogenase (short-subunit alcohol dehydrogenase family)